MKTNKQNKRLQDYRNGLRHEESQWKVRETFRFFLVSQCPPSPLRPTLLLLFVSASFPQSSLRSKLRAWSLGRPWEPGATFSLIFRLFTWAATKKPRFCHMIHVCGYTLLSHDTCLWLHASVTWYMFIKHVADLRWYVWIFCSWWILGPRTEALQENFTFVGQISYIVNGRERMCRLWTENKRKTKGRKLEKNVQ